jgi:hypothetical protein
MKKLTKEQQIEKKKKWQQELLDKGNAIKFDKSNKLCPRCIYDDQHITLSSEGYFTPCCWLDDELYRNQPYINDFFKPYLNIENNEDIQNIFDSKEWTKFWEILLNRPEDAPPVCYEYCASKKGDKEILEEKIDDVVIKRTH